jgi:hypothetical protein
MDEKFCSEKCTQGMGLQLVYPIRGTDGSLQFMMFGGQCAVDDIGFFARLVLTTLLIYAAIGFAVLFVQSLKEEPKKRK